MAERKFSIEGALHLYSSLPIALSPAALYQADKNPEIRSALLGCNLYMITRRTRIAIDPASVRIAGSLLTGKLVHLADSGWHSSPFEMSLPQLEQLVGADILSASATAFGTHLQLVSHGSSSNLSTQDVIALSKHELGKATDLEVLYIGQGIGRKHPRLAVDRLVQHSTLQKILAQTIDYRPECEIQVLLFRFEYARNFCSTGGDLTLTPKASDEEESKHFSHITSARVDRNERIALAEAALINHFKPELNITFSETNFASKRKLRTLDSALKNGLTGLIVEVCTTNIRARIKTDSQPPINLGDKLPPELLTGVNLTSDEQRSEWMSELEFMAHTHIASIPLTTPEDRDTFLHGIRWQGATDRAPLF